MVPQDRRMRTTTSRIRNMTDGELWQAINDCWSAWRFGDESEFREYRWHRLIREASRRWASFDDEEAPSSPRH